MLKKNRNKYILCKIFIILFSRSITRR